MGLKIEGEEVKSSGCICVKDIGKDREEVGFLGSSFGWNIYFHLHIHLL